MAHALDSAPSLPLAGQVIGGRFRVERELGEGGMGTVYAAVDLLTGAAVALKLMRPELSSDPRAMERFRREGAALAAVQHPSIVQIREIGELPDGSLYLAMELLRGQTLSRRLEQIGRMSTAELLPIVVGLCDGLAAAHAGGIIHRDIKPSNIHLPEGSDAGVKLVDFGVARVRGFSKVTSSGLAVGTVRYMAPEQLTGGAVDERADVYALGVVIYEALSGEHPFERTAGDDLIGSVLVGRATPLSSLRPDLSPAVTQVVHRAMARLPTERFASAGALATAFADAVNGSDALGPNGPPSDETRPGRPISVRPPPVAGPVALAATELATPQRVEVRGPSPSQSAVRTKARPRSPVWLLVPLLVGACLVPTGGVLGFIGCSGWMTDIQLELAARTVRGAIDEHAVPELAPELDRLEALHESDELNLLAAAAFNARVHHATREDDRLDRDELIWVMQIVRDIVAHGGSYDLEQYSKMTQGLRSS